MTYGPLDGAVEKIVKNGADITEYFLDLANFKRLARNPFALADG